MKKYLLFVFILLYTGGLLFANGVAIKGWGRHVFTPVWIEVPEDEKPIFTAGVGSLGARAGGFGFQIDASYDEKVGFFMEGRPKSSLNIETEYFYFWLQPFPWLNLKFNKFGDNTYSGKIGDTDLTWVVDNVYDLRNANDIFTEFFGNHGEGFMLGIKPPIMYIENLYIGFRINASVSDIGKPNILFKDAYKSMHVVLAYPFAYGTLRLGYMGPQADNSRYDRYGSARFEAAFSTSSSIPAVLHIPGNFIMDIGGKIWLVDAEKNGRTYQEPYSVSVGARWDYEDIWLQARFDAKFGAFTEYPNQKVSKSLYWATYWTGFYRVTNMIWTGFDFNFRVNSGEITEVFATNTKVVTKEGEYVSAIAPWARFAFGNNGMIKVAAVFKIPARLYDGTMRPFEFALPIIGEYWF